MHQVARSVRIGRGVVFSFDRWRLIPLLLGYSEGIATLGLHLDLLQMLNSLSFRMFPELKLFLALLFQQLLFVNLP
jgi:hypothetical protein